MTVGLFPLLLAVPLVGLALLLAVPSLDVEWEHHPSHFLLVLGVAVVNVVLAAVTSEAARRRDDTRLFLVSLALLSSAGFLALHALATPGVLLEESNSGFTMATPVGLLIASIFAALSAGEIEAPAAPAVLRRRRPLRIGLVLLLLAWGVASLAGLPLLDRPPTDEAPIVIRILAPIGVALYAFAAWRYRRLSVERRRTLPLAVAVAYVLLAEAMIAVALARNWHASWWEWHLLMAVSFAVVLVATRTEYRREGSVTGAFGGLYLQRTLDRVDRRSSEALGQLASAIGAGRPLAPLLERLRRDGFASEEVALLERAARELAHVDELFRPYVGPHLAERLRREPSLAELGGREAEVTVLFADLAGFTPFSEQRSPTEVVEMLNTYWAATVPIVAERERGLIERFAGDAILVVFNALGDQPDHARRGVVAAIAMQRAAADIAAEHPGWPRFRVGVNTGPAVLGNVGAGVQRSFTAIGDTANVAARLQTAAEPGGILIGQATLAAAGPGIEATPLGSLELKGKRLPVTAYRVG